MAGSRTNRPSELLSTARFREFLDEVKSRYDLVVVDTSPLRAVADTLQILPLVDALLFCVRDGRSTRDQVAGAKVALGHLPEVPAGLVVTGLTKDQRDNYGYYSYTQVYGSS
jgi:Mrp family chromosome partitioning ATPase